MLRCQFTVASKWMPGTTHWRRAHHGFGLIGTEWHACCCTPVAKCTNLFPGTTRGRCSQSAGSRCQSRRGRANDGALRKAARRNTFMERETDRLRWEAKGPVLSLTGPCPWSPWQFLEGGMWAFSGSGQAALGGENRLWRVRETGGAGS